jgi:mRNA interferase MazF
MGVGNEAVSWGEVWWLESPSLGRRPAAVLTRPEALAILPRILVAPATTQVRGLPSEVALDEDDGMPRPCVLNLDTPELVPRGMFIERITSLSERRMIQVCRALAAAVNC